MPSLWFVVPAYGRQKLAESCLRQLRRTCDSLVEAGIDATAVVVADDANLDTARNLGFGTVERDNAYVSARFNDGIQLALDPAQAGPFRAVGVYEVVGRRRYRGHELGTTFTVELDPDPEARAVNRGDIRLLDRIDRRLRPGSYRFPDDWNGRQADYVVPCGSDDWVDWRLFLDLPAPGTMAAFRQMTFVREDGLEAALVTLRNEAGCGIRIYPRDTMEAVGYRPADEDRERACDTSILVNLKRRGGLRWIDHRDSDHLSIVDWKTSGQQLNGYREVLARHRGRVVADPFELLRGRYPDEALAEMADHYAAQSTEAAASRIGGGQ